MARYSRRQTTEEERKEVKFTLPASLHSQLKEEAKRRGESMAAYIADLLADHFTALEEEASGETAEKGHDRGAHLADFTNTAEKENTRRDEGARLMTVDETEENQEEQEPTKEEGNPLTFDPSPIIARIERLELQMRYVGKVLKPKKRGAVEVNG